MFSTNKLPQVNDKGGGFISRVIVIPFNAKFSSTDPDFDPWISDKLKQPEALGYLLKLALEGLKRVVDRKAFTKPGMVENELDDYDRMNNPIRDYLDDANVENQSCGEVYRIYRQWCYDNGYQPMKQNNFAREVKRILGLKSKASKVGGKTVRYYVKVTDL
jgi:putative DNA primase/helicase